MRHASVTSDTTFAVVLTYGVSLEALCDACDVPKALPDHVRSLVPSQDVNALGKSNLQYGGDKLTVR